MGRLRQAARKLADSTVTAAQPLHWAVRVASVAARETTGLVQVERIVAGGGDSFWAQVRNSVYLAANDLIWVVKDPGAQDNWTFAGFVIGAGTGESVNNSPIPSVAAPVYTAPANTPIIIRPPAGEDMTLGRAGETIDVAGGLTIAEGITLSALGAGIVQSSAAGVLSSDYTIDATTTWATTTNIMPTDASGQDLGDATHRWDLFTQEVHFGGASGANVITVPNNLADALHLSDAGGIEYMRIVSTDAQPIVLFNEAGADVDFIVGAVSVPNALVIRGSDGYVGLNKVPAYPFDVTRSWTISAPSAAYLVTANIQKVITGAANQTNASFAPALVAQSNVAAGYSATITSLGAIIGDVTIQGGTVTAATCHQGLGRATAGATITHLYVFRDTSYAAGGAIVNHYLLYDGNTALGTNVSYGLYILNANNRNYLAGHLAVGGTNALTAQLLVDQSAAGGGIPVAILDQGDVSEQHIVCTMSGADVDFPAILQLAVTGTPTVGYDVSDDEFTLNKGLQITGGDLVFVNAGSGLSYAEIHAHNVAADLALAAQDTWYQIAAFDTDGESNNCTPDHTNDHITIVEAGDYHISLSWSGHSHNLDDYQIMVRFNNGTVACENITIHTTTAVAGRVVTSAAVGTCALSATDTVEAWALRTTGAAVERTLTTDHITLVVVQVGG